MPRTQVPAKYLDDEGNDFADPLSNLLISAGLLGQDNKNQADGLNELKEGALGLSKWLGGLAAAAGLVGIATSIGGAITSAHEPTRVALVAGGALLGAAGIISVALVVRADVTARARSTVAQYEARSQLGSAFLAVASTVLRPAPSSAAVTKNGGPHDGGAVSPEEGTDDSGLRAFGFRVVPGPSGGDWQVELPGGRVFTLTDA